MWSWRQNVWAWHCPFAWPNGKWIGIERQFSQAGQCRSHTTNKYALLCTASMAYCLRAHKCGKCNFFAIWNQLRFLRCSFFRWAWFCAHARVWSISQSMYRTSWSKSPCFDVNKSLAHSPPYWSTPAVWIWSWRKARDREREKESDGERKTNVHH